MVTFLKTELGEPRILVVLMITALKTLCTPARFENVFHILLFLNQ
jgi:hypothetical protein